MIPNKKPSTLPVLYPTPPSLHTASPMANGRRSPSRRSGGMRGPSTRTLKRDVRGAAEQARSAPRGSETFACTHAVVSLRPRPGETYMCMHAIVSLKDRTASVTRRPPRVADRRQPRNRKAESPRADRQRRGEAGCDLHVPGKSPGGPVARPARSARIRRSTRSRRLRARTPPARGPPGWTRRSRRAPHRDPQRARGRQPRRGPPRA